MNRQRDIDDFLLAMHRLAVERLRADPSRVKEVQAQLDRRRLRAGPTRADVCWDEWQRLLAAGSHALQPALCSDDEHGAVLRSVSPMSPLISQSERSRLLREARRG